MAKNERPVSRAHVPETGPRRARFSCITGCLLFAVLALPAAPAAAQDGAIPPEVASPALLRVRTLVRANVLDLAERIMERQGPPQLPNGEWLNWERQLWALYQSRGHWERLIERIQAIPPAFPAPVHEEADLVAISAYNALGDGVRSRRLLRRYLLDESISERERIPLRRQVIESYLVEGRLAEANAAARVFQADYRPQDREWLLLAARISLESGDPSGAVNLLAPLDDPAARILRLWGRIQDGSVDPQEAFERAAALAEGEAYESLQRPLLAMMTRAAGTGDKRIDQAALMERYLLADPPLEPVVYRSLPVYSVEDLVATYASIAANAANAAGLLVGEEQGWDDFARLLPVEETVMRRVVWGQIARNSDDRIARRLANDQWVNAALDGERMALVPLLFGEGLPLGDLVISPATALRLSNAAIEAGEVKLAALANSNVSGPPPGMSYGDWLLYAGRISIIAGQYDEGAERLRSWLQSQERLTPEQTDNVLQPIFDLQAVDQHAIALELLELVDARSPGGRYVREIAFWIAESHEALGEHMTAADYFLFSAMQKDNGFDQWGESARYRAADALLAGNFFSDARTLLEDLLRRAKDENRIQGLQQKLQQLWLRESNLGGGEGAGGSG